MAIWYASDNPGSWVTGERFSIDEPAQTFMAQGLAGDSLGHWHWHTDDARGVGEVIVSALNRVRSLDSPAPTVQTHGRAKTFNEMTISVMAGDDAPLSGDPGKPPYRIPTVVETRAAPKHGLCYISLFAGAGGGCYGLELDGWTPIWANEFIPIAAESYRRNHPGVPVDERSIRDLDPLAILDDLGLAVGELDLIEGSPPCESFSTAGKREKSWGKDKEYFGKRQRTDDLFEEYIRFVQAMQPKTFVAENVSGLVKGVSKGYFKHVLRSLRACGYRVEARLLDAQWLGVPQRRQRIIFIGVRDDLGMSSVFPKPLPYRYTIREALPWLDSASGTFVEGANGFGTSGGHAEFDVSDTPMPTIQAGRPVNVRAEPAIRLGAHGFQKESHVTIDEPMTAVCATGLGSYDYGVSGPLPPSRARAYAGEAAYNFTITDGDQPAPTVTLGSPGNDMGPPSEPRKFTILEVKRLSGFPDDYDLAGTYAEQWARLGGCVVPPMYQAVGREIRMRILQPEAAS